MGPCDCARLGWRLIPVQPHGKAPLIEAGKNYVNASSDVQQILKWTVQFPGCNWGLCLKASGLVCIDVDRKGVDEWESLVATHGEPKTLIAQSGSGVGRHYVFKNDAAEHYFGKLCEGIDIKHNGYIVIAPSIHPSGGEYRWLNDEIPVRMPEWLLGRALHREPERPVVERKAVSSEDIAQIKSIVADLKQFPLDYSNWIACGQAIKTALDGDGLEHFVELSRGVSYRTGDEDLAEAKWGTFAIDGERGFGTLVHLHRTLTKPHAEDVFVEVPNEDPRWTLLDGRWVTHSLAAALEKINDAGYAWIEDTARIACLHNDNGYISIQWIPTEGFRNTFAPYAFFGRDAQGKAKLMPIAAVWLQSHQRKSFRRIVFDPKAEAQDLNLWNDCCCTPEAGDMSDIFHLVRTLCSDNDDTVEYLLDWCAHVLRDPTHKTAVIPVLISREGTGKSMFAEGIFGGIFGQMRIVFQTTTDILNRFNINQTRKLLTILDESSWGGNELLVNRLKALSGSRVMTVEEKMGPCYEFPNHSRYFILSNDRRAVKLGFGNRRYLLIECQKKLSKEFFKKLGARVESGEASRVFLDFLIKRDLSNFSQYVFPEYADIFGKETKMASMEEEGKFWLAVLIDMPKPLWTVVHGEWRLLHAEAFEAFTDWMKKYGKSRSHTGFSPQAFWCTSERYLGLKPSARMHGSRYRVCTPTEIRDRLLATQRLNATEQTPLDSEYLMIDFAETVRPEDF